MSIRDGTASPGESGEAMSMLLQECSRLGIPLDGRALSRFARYLELLRAWEGRAGLTAVRDPAAVQRRHFGESLALLEALRGAALLRADTPATVVDLGPGAGFPGVPMSIAEPALELTLVEASAKRCRFLDALVTALELDNVRVVQARAEEAGRDPALRGRFDVAIARALAPLNVLVELALPLLRVGGTLATPKGSRWRAELADAGFAITALGGEALPSLPLALVEGAPPQQVLLVRRSGPLDERFPRRSGIPRKRPLTAPHPAETEAPGGGAAGEA